MIGLAAAFLLAAAAPSAAAEPPQPAVRARPLGPPNMGIKGKDYPKAARKRREEGWVGVRFAIDPQGRVANCTIIRSSGFASLDEATCRLARSRGRFEPARDARGRRVADSGTVRIVWYLGPYTPAWVHSLPR